MKRFKLLFLTTTLIFSSLLFAAEGGGGGSKGGGSITANKRAMAIAKIAASLWNEKLPDIDSVSALIEQSNTTSEEFSNQKFVTLLYKNLRSILNEQQLDMDAVRNLVDEWNKGEAVDLNVLIQETTDKILHSLHEKLKTALRPVAEKQALSPYFDNEFIESFFTSLDEELQEPLRMRLALMILQLHEKLESHAERAEDSLEQKEFYQSIIAKTEENLGRSLVSALAKTGCKKVFNLIIPGSEAVLTFAERAQGVVPKKAIGAKKGDSIAMIALATTAGQQKNAQLQTFHKYNPVEQANHWLNKLLAPASRKLGGCFRRAAQNYCIKPAIKAQISQTVLDLLNQIARTEIKFGTAIQTTLTETCRIIDEETAEKRDAYLVKKLEEETQKAKTLKEQRHEVLKKLRVLEEEKKILHENYDQKRDEELDNHIKKLKIDKNERESLITTGWIKDSPFQAQKNEELKKVLDAIEIETQSEIYAAEEPLKEALAADMRGSIAKSWSDTQEVATERALFEEKKAKLQENKRKAIIDATEKHKSSVKEENTSIEEDISKISEEISSQQEALSTLRIKRDEQLATITQKELTLQDELNSFKPSTLEQFAYATQTVVSSTLEHGGSIIGEQSAKALAKKLSNKNKIQDQQKLATGKNRLEQRKARKFLAWSRNNPKKAISLAIATASAGIAAVPITIGIGAATYCNIMSCDATITGVAGKMTTHALYAIAIPVGIKSLNKAFSCLIGHCQKNKAE